MARRRGGQPGNTNALKHGFYSGKFRAVELGDLEGSVQDGLGDEIALMRVMIRRVFKYASEEAITLEAWQGALCALGAASTRLAGLMKTQKVLGKSEGDVVSALSQALSEVTKDFNH